MKIKISWLILPCMFFGLNSIKADDNQLQTLEEKTLVANQQQQSNGIQEDESSMDRPRPRGRVTRPGRFNRPGRITVPRITRPGTFRPGVGYRPGGYGRGVHYRHPYYYHYNRHNRFYNWWPRYSWYSVMRPWYYYGYSYYPSGSYPGYAEGYYYNGAWQCVAFEPSNETQEGGFAASSSVYANAYQSSLNACSQVHGNTCQVVCGRAQ